MITRYNPNKQCILKFLFFSGALHSVLHHNLVKFLVHKLERSPTCGSLMFSAHVFGYIQSQLESFLGNKILSETQQSSEEQWLSNYELQGSTHCCVRMRLHNGTGGNWQSTSGGIESSQFAHLCNNKTVTENTVNNHGTQREGIFVILGTVSIYWMLT